MTTSDSRTADDLQRYAELLAKAEAIHGVSLWQDAWRRLKKNRVAMTALVFLVVLGILALLTPLLPLQSPRKVDTARQFSPPSLSQFWSDELLLEDKSQPEEPRSREELIKESFGDLNWLSRGLLQVRLYLFKQRQLASFCGTDMLGRDVLARLFWGARISLLVGLVATFVSLVIGVSYGATAGYLGGWVDNAMMRFVDILYSVPFIFVVIFLITILSEDSIKTRLEDFGINRITIFYWVVGAIYWLTMSRVIRGQVVSLKNDQFVDAARTIGAGRLRIIFRHLAPNVLSVVIVYLTLTIPNVMLFEAFLSFLGLGVESPDVSWGLLANDGLAVITPIGFQWWLAIFPGLALGATLFALNFLGDGLRDALDPRLKNRT